MSDESVPPKMHAGGGARADVGPARPPGPSPRGRRTPIGGVVAKLALFLLWNIVSVGVLLLPLHPLAMAVLELAVVALFAWRYLLPRRHPPTPHRDEPPDRKEGARRAALRLRSVPRSAWGIVAAWVAATLVLDHLVSIVYFRLVPRAADYPDPFADLLARPVGWLPVYAAMVLAAPLIEEVAFRGWVQRPLERWVGAAWAIVATSLLFALAHGLQLLIPYYFVAGVALGASVYLTRSLWVGIVTHAAHNAWSVGSDGIGLTNERMIAWAERPALFWLAVAGLAGWVVLMTWLGRRMQAASRRRPRSARSARLPLAPRDR